MYSNFLQVLVLDFKYVSYSISILNKFYVNL